MSWMRQALIIFIFIFSALSYGKVALDEYIQPDELPFLEFFLRRIIFEHHFGYVLFAEKPMGFFAEGKPELISKEHRLDLLAQRLIVQRKGYEVFRKFVSTHTPNENFIILLNEDRCRHIVFLINRQSFLKTVSQHLKEFRRILGDSVTGKDLLAKILNEKDVLKCLNYHEGLLGILLGYGQNNAYLFYRRKELQKKPTILFSVEKIEAKLQVFDASEYSFLRSLTLPTFVADTSSEETRYLKKLYCEQRKRVARAYKNVDFLNTTLLRLVS